MEVKINIVEILKDKPQGIKLYSSACGKCKLEEVDDKSFKISFYNSKFGFMNGGEGYLDKNGKLYDDGECVVFPSKEMRDWEKFSWKKGDVLVSKDNVYIIFEKFEDDTYTRFKGKHYLWKECNVEDYNKEETKMLTSVFEKATDDVAQTYIKTIEEHLDGKLNLETLEIEKQLEFKDGDIVVYGKSVAICRKIYKHTLYFYVSIDETFGLLFDDNRVSSEGYRFATDEEMQQLFDALDKEGKRWNAENKQIEDLPKKYEFKPFQKVLAKFDEDCEWMPDFFYYYDKSDSEMPYVCIANGRAIECIPYNEETKHLLGTTDEWKGGE